jgi:hypothetical protein
MLKRVSIFLVLFVLFAAAGSFAQTGTAEVPKKTDVAADNNSITDNDDALIMLELVNGDKIIVTIVKETKDTLMIDNPLGTMRVSLARNKIASMRKPTAKEMDKLRALVAAQKPQV